jgi:asparagine synthase (glutamine-hydrolysing)
MCGIWITISSSSPIISKSYKTIQKRGPDDSRIVTLPFAKMVFYRLAIQDLSSVGMQPFMIEKDNTMYYLMCNGEIYNWKELVEKYNLVLESNSDCEVILALYLYFQRDILQVLKEIRGEFAFVLLSHTKGDSNMNGYATRDPYGVRPLFVGVDDRQLQFSSLLKGISTDQAKQMEPGQVYFFTNQTIQIQKSFYSVPHIDTGIDKWVIYKEVCHRLIQAVKDRLISDRPLGALLSGGLDSSLVVAIAHKILKTPVQVFCIGLEGCESTDVFYAKQVVEHLEIQDYANIVLLNPNDALSRIEQVIEECETYDITTIRASIMQYSIAKHISENTSIKVILNGDGADELQMGYLYFRLAPDLESAKKENYKLLNEIHFFDGLRVDRCISSFGLEARLPYLDTNFVDYFLNIPDCLKAPFQQQEKLLIRNAFHTMYPGLLPETVLFRQKEAFSDGVSSTQDSWYKRLQDHIDSKVSQEEFETNISNYSWNTPISKESYYYRKIFDKIFKGKYETICPHFWQPNFTTVNDPSARELDIYAK